jgi:hypothetical protein
MGVGSLSASRGGASRGSGVRREISREKNRSETENAAQVTAAWWVFSVGWITK